MGDPNPNPTHGIPRKIRTDSGPPFNGDEFKQYMEALGIEGRTSTPLWRQANRNAESIMKPIGKVIKTATLEGKNWRQEVQRFLIHRTQQPKSLRASYCSIERYKELYLSQRRRRLKKKRK